MGESSPLPCPETINFAEMIVVGEMSHFSLSSRDNGLLSSFGSPQDCFWTSLHPFISLISHSTFFGKFVALHQDFLLSHLDESAITGRVFIVAKLGMRGIFSVFLIK